MINNLNKSVNEAVESIRSRVATSPFVPREIDRSYVIQGEVIHLRQHPDVFSPSAFGVRFADEDIGTGTGLLAILSAKKGAREIVATDTSETALQIARFNAHTLNQAGHVKMYKGSFFCDATGAFDAITANLPQEIVPPRYLAELNEEQAQAVCGGGAGGNAVLLAFLRVARDYMCDASRLYVIVNTVTDYKATMAAINEMYSSRRIWGGIAPTKEFVGTNIGWFGTLIDNGVIDIFQDHVGHWHAHQFIYELKRSPG
jgi:methylase of polypeptide subunit release factors